MRSYLDGTIVAVCMRVLSVPAKMSIEPLQNTFQIILFRFTLTTGVSITFRQEYL